MSIRLHPDVFRSLAAWRPGAREGTSGAERLMATGGITVPTLMLLHEYAASRAQSGQDKGLYEYTGSALLMVDLQDYLWFGPRTPVDLGVEGATYTEVRATGLDPYWIYHSPAGAESEYGVHRMETESGVPVPDTGYTESKRIEEHFNLLLSGRNIAFLERAA